MQISTIRWPLVLGAGVLSEGVVVAVLSIIILSYRFVIAPGQPSEVYEAFGHRTGHYVAPYAAGLSSMALAIWVGGRLTMAFVLHGLGIGVVGVLCALVFFLAAGPEERFMYIVSFGLRIAGGVGGGLIARSLAASHQ